MTTRLYLAYFCSILLLAPTASWAADETDNASALQTAPVIPAPAAQISPQQSTPAKPATQTEGAEKETAVPAKTLPAPVAPAKPLPASAVPAKPLPAPVAPAKPLPVPVTPVQTQPAPAAPAKPLPTPSVPARPLVAPAAPAKPMPVPTIPAKPGPGKTSPDQAGSTLEGSSSSASITDTADIEVFVREECQNCDKATEFLQKLHSLQPQLKINIRDVRKEPAALVLLKRVAENQGGVTLNYPAFVVGGQLIVGFSDDANTAQKILDNLPLTHSTGQQTNENMGSCNTGKEPGCGLIPVKPATKPEKISFNLFGHNILLEQIGLPVFTLAMGILDGLNHGSTWVLLLMVSLLAPMKNRTLMLSIAGTFIAVKGLMYFILLAVWLNLFMIFDMSYITQLIAGCVALLAGAIYFKNYFMHGKRITLLVHEINKPGVYTRIRKIVQTESLVAALLGTVVLSIFVQLGELSYTSVFPALYTKILTLYNLTPLGNYGYLMLYDFAYMLDDIIVLGIGIVTFNSRQAEEYKSSLLKLVSALSLIAIGVYLLLVHASV